MAATVARPRPALSSAPVVPANSITNRAPSAASSLYQNCLTVLERLYRVPGFADRFLRDNAGTDPVSRVLAVFRLGSSLCYLYNLMPVTKRLPVNDECVPEDLKACKSAAAHFIMNSREQHFWDNLEDSASFTVTMLYDQDTNGTVRVVNSISHLLTRLEQLGILLPPQEVCKSEKVSLAADERAQVVNEILDSERKYVQDLEVLQEYQYQLLKNDIITPDIAHHLFLNLNTLVDFQRRFLIGVEANASQPPELQRFGLLFQQMEDNFSCYEPYCANYTAAHQLAIREAPTMKSLNILDPFYELPTFLIKPVQRICKYPLLLQQLLKASDSNSEHYQELVAGLDSIKAGAERVNETRRRQENEQAVKELVERVEDWKGHDRNGFGNLLLESVLMVIKNDSEREYHVYLFERIILCCREAAEPSKKKDKSKKDSSIKNRKPSKLHLKGRIFINNVLNAVPTTKQGSYILQVTWRGDLGEESFSIKFTLEDQLRQWQRVLTKAVEDSVAHRRSRPHMHTSSSSSSSATRSRIGSPMSQFPNTPLTECVPTPSSLSSDSLSARRYQHGSVPYFQSPELHNDEELREEEHYFSRSTQSLPPNARGVPMSHRPRAQTEDSYTGVINQWQTHSSHASHAESVPGRHEAERTPRAKYSQSPQQITPMAGFPDGRRTPLAPSHSMAASVPVRKISSSAPTSELTSMRTRSVPSHEMDVRTRSAPGTNGYPHPPPVEQSTLPPGSVGNRQSVSSAGTDASSARSSYPSQCQSSSTSPTDTTYDYFTQPDSKEVEDRSHPPPSASLPADQNRAVRVKVNYGRDTLTVVVLHTITYKELVQKIIQKIKSCGGHSGQLDENTIRVKYVDEEGDKVLLTEDPDLDMALEWSRAANEGRPGPPCLELFVH